MYFCPKMVSFKEKNAVKLSFDAEDDRLGAKRRRFRFFKQALIFGHPYYLPIH